MKTIVYIDGFNLYYAIRKSGNKWLNVEALCKKILPKDDIIGIKYYTAQVKVRKADPKQKDRQNIYFRALETIPNLEIIKGKFMTHEVFMPLASDPTKKVQVIKTEEKGSDVNVATDLLVDGFLGRYDKAAVITNDSDLVRPIQKVIEVLKLPVGIIIPPTEHPNQNLINAASFVRKIRNNTLEECLFPNKLRDSNGTFRKPNKW